MTSESVNALSWQAEVFYRRLMSVVDDYGRYFAKPSLLRASCYPLQLDKVDDTDITKMLIEVCNAKPDPLATVYETGGRQYIQLMKFKQQVRAKESKFPDPPIDAQRTLRGCIADAHLGGDGGVVGDVVEGEGDKGNPKVSIPPCPHQAILGLYAHYLPMGRQVRPPWNGGRAQALSARWKELKERQRIEWWEAFFQHCAKSDFLTGRVTPRGPGRKPFEVSMDWIVNATNFQKIIEGAYDD